jgi:MFS transporter, OFA family, oxalate/formate antiporter
VRTSDSGSSVDISTQAYNQLGFSRWWQLFAAVVIMGFVSPYKYIWSSIQQPLATKFGISLPALGFVFTLYIFSQVAIQFPAGWYRDRFGPRAITVLAGVLAGGGYVGIASATQLWQIYVLYSLGAIGVGIVYMVAVNTALKWFPDRRGLATGLGTMAFAAGSVVFIPYVRANATADAVASVLQYVGILIAIAVAIGALILRDPPENWPAKPSGSVDTADDCDSEKSVESDMTATSSLNESMDSDVVSSATDRPAARQYTWRAVTRTWQFWLLTIIFAAIAGTNLMLAANLVSFAENADVGTAVVTTAAVVLPVGDGLGRLGAGGLSDWIGRKRTMVATFSLCGVGLVMMTIAAEVGSTAGFLSSVALATFFQGTQYTLLPSLVTDYYGQRYSSTNYAMLYLVQIISGVFGGVGVGWLVAATGWFPTFLIGGGLALIAGMGAVVLRPPAA